MINRENGDTSSDIENLSSSDVHKLIDYGIWLLEWHNSRARDFMKRSTFWLTSIVAQVFASITVLLAIDFSFNQLDAVFLTGLVASGFLLTISIYEFQNVIRSEDVVIVDASALRKFAEDLKSGVADKSINDFLLNETFCGDSPSELSVIEAASREADLRAEHYGRATKYLGSSYIVLALLLIYGAFLPI